MQANHNSGHITVCRSTIGREVGDVLEGEVIGPPRWRSVDLHCASLHGVADVDGLVDVVREDATLQGPCTSDRRSGGQPNALAHCFMKNLLG